MIFGQDINREFCYCCASDHPLINNCLKCGHVVCEREGEGPCLYCSNPVYKESTSKKLKEEEQFRKKFAGSNEEDEVEEEID